MKKPTLQEIANLPHTQAVAAMREHYDPQWPMVTFDPDDETECEGCGEIHAHGVLEDGFCPVCVENSGDWSDG